MTGQGERGATGSTGAQGRTGMPGRQGRPGRAALPLSSTRGLALFAVVVMAFVALAVRTEIQARQIRHNQDQINVSQQRIARIQYEQCALRNVGTRRQNTLLDSAIAAERRRPKPDLKRIKDLTDFKAPLLDCGTAP